MRWRVIEFEHWTAAMNMAIDEAISIGLGKETSPPTIRFYGWRPSAVSLGRFQSAEDELDLEACASKGIEVVRRRTGGGAVYHDENGEVTYSVICSEDLVPRDINAAYREICGCIVTALSELGVDAEFSPINDVLVKGKKISGSAQTRRAGVLLQHGTLLLSLDARTMLSVLRIPEAKLRDKGIASAEERMTSLKALTDADLDQVLEALERAFTSEKEWFSGSLTAEEMETAEQLVRSRYSTPAWTFER
jgi:lipoate-protein ligase A